MSSFLLTIVIIAACCFALGFLGRMAKVPPFVLGLVGMLLGAMVALLINSRAEAVPVDVEAFKQPVKYRECRPLTWDDVQTGKDVLPLPPDCVMKPPAQRAEISKHEAKPAVNPFAQFARY